MASQSTHFWLKGDDGNSIALDPKIKDGLTVPALSISVNSTGLKVIGAAQTLSATGTYVPIQQYLSVAADVVDSTVGTTYLKVVTAANMVGQIANLMVRVTLSHNVFDAYGVQSHLVFGTSSTISTTDANAHLTAISGKVTCASNTVSKGWVTAGLFIWEGAGTITQMGHVVSIVNEAGSTGAQSMLHLNDDVGTVPYFSFAGADGDGKGLYTGAVPDTLEGSVKCLINGTAHYIAVYANQHA
jgi:hypothetical protein